MKSILSLFLVSLLSLTSGVAQADAVLSHSTSGFHFPLEIDAQVDVRSQVEVASYLLHFPDLEAAGDYVLTVPGPKDAYVVGLDMDRGEGFVPVPMVGEAPPPAVGGSPVTQDPAVAQWLGTRPLRADLADLVPGPLTVRIRFQRLLRRYQGSVDFFAGVERSPLRPVGSAGAKIGRAL